MHADQPPVTKPPPTSQLRLLHPAPGVWVLDSPTSGPGCFVFRLAWSWLFLSLTAVPLVGLWVPHPGVALVLANLLAGALGGSIVVTTVVAPAWHWLRYAARSLALGLRPIRHHRAIIRSPAVILQTESDVVALNPSGVVVEMSRGPITRRWRFKVDAGRSMKVFSGLDDADAAVAEAALRALGFAVLLRPAWRR